MTTNSASGPDRDSGQSAKKQPPFKGFDDLSLVTAWDDRGRLQVTDGVALAHISRPYLSPSTMGSMKDCTARWAAERLMPRHDDPMQPAGLGTAVHTVFERLMEMSPHQRTRYHAHEIVNQVAREVLGGVDQARALPLAAKMLPKVDGYWDIENPVDQDVLGTEFKANGIEIEGIPFMGIIDLVTRVGVNDDGGDRVRIGDFKSGALKSASYYKRFGDNYGDQIRLYKMAWEATHPKDEVVIGTLLHPDPDPKGKAPGKQRVIDISPEEMATTVRRYKRAWKTLQQVQDTGTFTTKVSGLCGYCPLVAVCPSARAEEKEAKVETPAIETLPMTATHRAEFEAEHAADDALLGAGPLPLPTDLASDEDNPEEIMMTNNNNTRMFGDGKAWDETDGHLLNGNSYAAIGLFGVVSMAVDHLGKAGQPITPSNVRALSQTFAKVVLAAQQKVAGVQSWQDGSNTRMRGALHTVLGSADMALPWGEDQGAWREWALKAVRRSVSIATVVNDLWAIGPADAPWEALAVTDMEDVAA